MPPTNADLMSITRRQDKLEKKLLDELEPLMHLPIYLFNGSGTYVRSGERRIRLMARDSKATQAGLVYYELILGIKPPALYDYNQELELDKFVTTWEGKRSKCGSADWTANGLSRRRERFISDTTAPPGRQRSLG